MISRDVYELISNALLQRGSRTLCWTQWDAGNQLQALAGRHSWGCMEAHIKCAVLQRWLVCSKILPVLCWLTPHVAYYCHCLHMQSGLYFVYWRACEITICYAISVCKYAYCTTGGLPVICVCGLCPVSAEGEFEKDTIVVEWKFQIQICLPFSSAAVVHLYHTLIFFHLIFIHFLPFMWRFKGVFFSQVAL